MVFSIFLPFKIYIFLYNNKKFNLLFILMKKVEIYSDWWARPNPGPWGYWVILKFWDKQKELSWFEQNTTNNRMELTWAIKWLEELKEACKVDLYTDSSYVVNWIEKWWAEKWKTNNWMRTKKDKAVNYDLWEKLLEEVWKHKVKFHWVKWHAGHKENERCDELATQEILKNTWKIEEVKNLDKQDLLQKVLNTWLDNSQKNIKVVKVWQPCKKCGTPVEIAIPKKKNTKNKSYYYKYYLTCPNCKTNYFVDEAKVII